MEIVWSPLSLQDIEEIGDYISKDSPETAVAFVEELIMSVERLIEYPESGSLVQENPVFRQVVFKKYRIIYFLEIDTISIITVLSPGRLGILKGE